MKKILVHFILLLTIIGCSGRDKDQDILTDKEIDIVKEYINEQIALKNSIKLKERFGTNLRGLKLVGVDLSGEDLSDIDFSKAELIRVTFQGNNLRNVNFKNAIIQESNFSKMTFQDLNLSKVDFQACVFDKVDFNQVNLSYANLEETIFKNVFIQP